jgi:uncharacterized protein involved in exopolysaccharide biosynthesis
VIGSLIEELRRREAAARAEADRLRSRIEELADDLAGAKEQVWRLAIAPCGCRDGLTSNPPRHSVTTN